MQLSVYVLGREVATLEQVGDFKSVLTYHPNVAANDFISLTMPVRSQSYVWDDQLPPALQMNLPEGYLLQVLQEQFGPHISANPIALLSVIGRNMVGRVQVAGKGANLLKPAQAFEIDQLLKGDNSPVAFANLVREHANSGVSGVVPKFLDPQLSIEHKASLVTHLHIIKGSSARLPFIALNEHLCMEVARRILPSANTAVSRDGQALVVDRFDVNENGQACWGMEDFCSLLGLRPAAKYDTTWERIAKAVRDHIPGSSQLATFRQLAGMLLLNYALRNANCHAKNLALLYTSREDVKFAPMYDGLTTSVYAGFAHNPPSIEFMGKKTWTPGKSLQRFIATTFGITPKEQLEMVQAISDAVADVAPQVRLAMKQHPGFNEIGKRMLSAWSEGVRGLRDERIYATGEWNAGSAFDGFSPPSKVSSAATIASQTASALLTCKCMASLIPKV
jgi:serine/threonine-protein kinase HipA